MRRWAFLALLLIVIVASFFILRQRLTTPNVSLQHLVVTTNSAYKYNLCTEAFAFAHAGADNPYKTDYSFHDPFRNADDTIVPQLLDLDQREQTVSFNVKIIVGQLGTFSDSISHVSVLDGISVLLPDQQGKLQRPSIPQIIVSSLNGNGGVAVLDFTCSEQWKWKAV
jgi:hypothetical protein